jgi:hypothetical protein
VTEGAGTDWSALVFRERLAQPDQRSCGATVLVVARMLLDPAYAELVATGRHPVTGFALPGDPAGRFRYEVLAMHARVTGLVDARGHLQVPWPRVLGTPPWAVAHQLSATRMGAVPAAPYSARPAWSDGAALFDRLVEVTGRHQPVPVYVGSRWMPRHVVLAIGEVGGRLRCYEPAAGVLVDVGRDAFAQGRLGLAGWARPWFVVTPTP